MAALFVWTTQDCVCVSTMLKIIGNFHFNPFNRRKRKRILCTYNAYSYLSMKLLNIFHYDDALSCALDININIFNVSGVCVLYAAGFCAP